MNQIVPIRQGALTGSQLDLVKRTVAKDTTPAEFDHFMHTAQHLGLDPLRKQILCVVFNKNKPDKRNMTIIVPQDGLRVIAARQRDYGPARDEPEIEYDAALKSEINPHGIVRAKVTLWKLYADGWHPVVATAYWDEFAAIDEEVEWRENDQGKRYPHKTGKQALADNWKRMGRVMIAKCATCQALRAGWPDDFAGVYGEEEIQRAVIIDAASEVVAEHQEQQRLARVGTGDGLLFVFEAGGNLINVERGNVADRLTSFYEREAKSAQDIIDFRTRNEASLKTFWAWAPGDALEVKKVQERRIAELINEQKSGAGAASRTDEDGDRQTEVAPGGASSSPSSSSFEKLKQDCLDCLTRTAPRRSLAAWRKAVDEAKDLTDAERAELAKVEANVREEISG
jgi:phage recombination protein Bet